MAVYQSWLKNGYFDEETRKELEALKDKPSEIEDRFYRNLEFGTGGLRGVIGAGTNRMNRYVVRRATQGLSSYLKKNVSSAPERGVVIAYDSRHMSPEFALETALVLASNGIKAYLFDKLTPTPELSFAVRHLGAAAGVVITASHNPAEYNGYKVYGEDGCQLTPASSEMVMNEINNIEDIASIDVMDREEAFRQDLIEMIGEQVDNEYMEYLKTLCLSPELTKQQRESLKLVYTPLHGTGSILVKRILKETGFENVIVVKEQEMPDPAFPTVKYPNPEEKVAFEKAVALAENVGADLIIGTDPDCDRVGVVVKGSEGDYEILTGNQVGCLLLEYILSRKVEKGQLPANGFVATTIVSTRLAQTISEFYRVRLVEVLTGFKYIGEKIKELEDQGHMKFLFGFEESYGYLAGSGVRDKDGVVSSMLIAEMAAYYKARGKTLYDALKSLFEKYGYYFEGVKSFTLTGKEGEMKIKEAMERLRREKPFRIGQLPVVKMRDYLPGGELPPSDVLYFEMQEKDWFCIRPSGTEPKIKIYYGTRGWNEAEARKRLDTLENEVTEVIKPLLGI